MSASPWYYIRNQVIEENANFNLLPSQNVQGYTYMREHRYFKNVNVTVFNKNIHTPRSTIKKIIKIRLTPTLPHFKFFLQIFSPKIWFKLTKNLSISSKHHSSMDAADDMWSEGWVFKPHTCQVNGPQSSSQRGEQTSRVSLKWLVR